MKIIWFILLLTSLPFWLICQHRVSLEDDRSNIFLQEHFILHEDSLQFHAALAPYPSELLMHSISAGLHQSDNNFRLQESSWLLSSWFHEFHDDKSRVQALLDGEIDHPDPLTELPFLSKKPIWRHFYKSRANLLEYHSDPFSFILRPVLRLEAGPMQNDSWYFYNRRGVILEGQIDRKVFFHSRIYETQARWPNFVRQYIRDHRTIPGEGYFKDFDSRVLDLDESHDFMNATSYLSFRASPHISLTLGYGNNFFGEGIRSLFLSDFHNNYFYLRADTRVWRFHYTNLFAELATTTHREVPGDGLIPKKYMASHYLSLALSDRFQLGLFETIIFSRESGFELQYLNPIIFYRVVEHGLGSPDNVLLGLSASWNALNRFKLYGQFILDEFRFGELFVERRGWWGNKFGFQLGMHYPRAFGIEGLSLKAEINTVRPYTYSEIDSTGSYTHFNQELAHPLGANFREFIADIRWQLTPNWRAEAIVSYAVSGESGEDENYGNDLRRSNLTRVNEFGNSIGQGFRSEILYLHLSISREIAHDFYIDLYGIYRQKTSEIQDRSMDSSHIGLSFRWNIGTYRPVF